MIQTFTIAKNPCIYIYIKTINLPNSREDTREGGVQLVRWKMSRKAPAMTWSWCYDGWATQWRKNGRPMMKKNQQPGDWKNGSPVMKRNQQPNDKKMAVFPSEKLLAHPKRQFPLTLSNLSLSIPSSNPSPTLNFFFLSSQTETSHTLKTRIDLCPNSNLWSFRNAYWSSLTLSKLSFDASC